MELHELEAFMTVIREGSFSAAAKALYRTQPAVSQIIRRLEDKVGQPLFDRASRRVVLTDAGRVLQVHAERLLNLQRQAAAALDDVRELRSGRVTIAANEVTCLYLLPVLHEFRRLYPSVHVRVERSLASRVPAAVREYAADLGVITYAPEEVGLRVIAVYRDELALVVPAGHPLASARRVTLAQLASESFIAHQVASPYRRRVIDAFRRQRVELRMPIEMPTIEAIKRFVALGNGVALLPALSVEPEVARGELIRVPAPELAFERRVRLVHLRRAALPHAVTAFLAMAESYATRVRGRHLFRIER